LRQHKELAELEAGDDSPAPDLGEVVLVLVADAFDEAMGSWRWMSV